MTLQEVTRVAVGRVMCSADSWGGAGGSESFY